MHTSLFNIPGRAFVFIILALSAAGCTKKNDPAVAGGDYYAKFKVNGEQKDYRGTSGASTSYQASDKLYQLSIGVFKNTTSIEKSENITIVLYSNTAFTAGTTYKASETVKQSGLNVSRANLTFSLNPQVGSFITPPNNIIAFYPHLLLDCTVTITAIGSGSVKGSFSAHAYDDLTINTAAHIKYLTEGEFFLKTTP